jgi:hypothetical protein
MSSYLCDEIKKKISTLILEGEDHYKKLYDDKYDIELQIIKDIQAELQIEKYEDAKQFYKIIKYKNVKQD